MVYGGVRVVTHLYLIRHGEAISNVEPIIGGPRGDTGLTPHGMAQAERLRDRLATTREIAADVLIASTLPRARQTAEIIAPALGLSIVWSDEVQELRPGDADGLSLDEFRERFGEPEFEHDPFRPVAPGGESWAAFMVRVGATLHRIARTHDGQTVVIVCHGGVIEGSFQSFGGMGLALNTRMGFHTSNTSLTHWERRIEGNGSPRWWLHSYNDDAHLRFAAADTCADYVAEQAEHTAVPLPTEASGTA
jgi:probable phosphoglycerate mutase